MAPWKYNRDQWICFDDVNSAAFKVMTDLFIAKLLFINSFYLSFRAITSIDSVYL